jgi:hypothetical protein
MAIKVLRNIREHLYKKICYSIPRFGSHKGFYQSESRSGLNQKLLPKLRNTANKQISFFPNPVPSTGSKKLACLFVLSSMFPLCFVFLVFVKFSNTCTEIFFLLQVNRQGLGLCVTMEGTSKTSGIGTLKF